jgi:hypothetical protein
MFQVPTTAGFSVDTYHSVSNVIGDVDNDGYTDILVNNEAPANRSLWRNSGGTNNWVKINLTGVQSNKNGIGSWIEMSVNGQILYRYTLCGESFLGQNSGTEIFGVGSATNLDYIKVNWLSGVEDMLTDVTPNQTLNVVEGSTTLSSSDTYLDTIKLFPNPSNGMVYFKNNGDILKIDVLDASGRKMDSIIIDQRNSCFEMSSYSKGIYFFSMKINERTITKKLVLN